MSGCNYPTKQLCEQRERFEVAAGVHHRHLHSDLQCLCIPNARAVSSAAILPLAVRFQEPFHTPAPVTTFSFPAFALPCTKPFMMQALSFRLMPTGSVVSQRACFICCRIKPLSEWLGKSVHSPASLSQKAACSQTGSGFETCSMFL